MSSSPTSTDEPRRPYYPEGGFCCVIICAFLLAGVTGGSIGYAIKPHNSNNLLLGGIFGVCGLVLLGLAFGAGIRISTHPADPRRATLLDKRENPLSLNNPSASV